MQTERDDFRQPELIPACADGDVALDAAGLTDIGLVRGKNEDAYLIGTLQRSLVVHDATGPAQGLFAGDAAGTLLVVADGMGGQGGGDIASHTAIDAVTRYLLNALPWAPLCSLDEQRVSDLDLRGQLTSALVAGDLTVKTAGAKTSTPRMGTTLTAAFVLWPVAYVAHVGDTRCYLHRAGRVRRLTTDHNLAEKLGAAEHGGRVDLQSMLWNTLGADDQLPCPELSKLELALGDTLLLCSDGLNHHVSDEQIQEVLERGTSSAACCAALVDLALDGGGSDNVTVLVAQLKRSAAPRSGFAGSRSGRPGTTDHE